MLSTLIRLALPTVIVLFMTTVLSVAETYFVSGLGMEAIAGASLVVPVMMLMSMVSNGGIGGGVSSAIARARGAGRQQEAESLAWHTVVIGVVAGGLFTVAMLLGGPALYRGLGGSGRSLDQAVLYSTILFAGAIPFWTLMLLQAALRGAGNVKIPALVMLGGVAAGLVLSPVLIMGWLGAPRMGIAGAGLAQVLCNIGALAIVVRYMRSGASTLRLRLYPLRRAHFSAILGIGLMSAINAIMAALSITALTAAAGAVGVAAIAGYGIASRLDMLLVPVMFGFGTAAITLVGTSLGAGDVARARRIAIVNVVFVAAVVGVIGLVVSMFPQLWLGLFTSDATVLAVGAQYLHIVAPFYAVTAVIFELYFAGQGAQRIAWPMTASVVRFAFALLAMVLVIQGYASLTTAFVLVAASIVVAATISLTGFFRTRWGQ
ncbi:MATE family efflux transporter [Rugamonas sp.]|uniref:MATE family efflux transporter n=1 Tax=Rugamonas sp. TaxID=1926287 RepID=UPI0025EEBA68|nr:MATE family efflux transporter [Rugamonas sp.]